MGRSAGTVTKTSIDSQFFMEEDTLYQHVYHGPPIVCSHADDGALLWSLVSQLKQSSQEATKNANQISWQEVQLLPPLQASIRFVPSMILAAVLNLVTGLIVDKFPVIYLVLISSGLGALAPLLMAVSSPSWPYWYTAFPAQLFEPLSPDGKSSHHPTFNRLTEFTIDKFTSDIHSRHPPRL